MSVDSAAVPRGIAPFLTRSSVLWYTGDAVKTLFKAPKLARRIDDLMVFVNGALKRPKDKATAYDFSFDATKGMVTFTAAPGAGQYVALIVQGR